MELDALALSRWQFAFTIMFHYLFPPLSIGLGALLVFMEGMYLRTGDKQYHRMTKFWTGIFAVNFAVGVASGIVMEFQFGTNWSRYAKFVGDVFGSALAAEGIFAFFLESGFLAVLVFGWDRVSPRFHFFATLMVALGSIFSAIWIVIANSWMQTPAGHHIVGEGAARRAEIVDFWGVVFNPSSMDRLVHTILGAFILGAFFVMSVTAFYLLTNRHTDFARKAFTIALLFGTAASLGQGASGDRVGRLVARLQPAKFAAFEALYRSEPGPTAMSVIGIPDSKAGRIRYGIEIPYLLSFLVHRDFSTPVPGLDIVPPGDRPPVPIPYFAYHLMIGLGTFFILLTLFACYLRWRGTLFETRWLLWVFVFAVAGPYLANQAGWVAAEVGRQPWSVYGVFRTSEGNSPAVPASHIVASSVLFAVVYALLFAVWVYVLHTKITHGPEEGEHPAEDTSTDGLFEAAARRVNPSGFSLTDPKDRPAPAAE